MVCSEVPTDANGRQGISADLPDHAASLYDSTRKGDRMAKRVRNMPEHPEQYEESVSQTGLGMMRD